MFFWVLSWIGLVGEVCFSVFALGKAAGLYYLAELVEEYSVLAKRVITYLLVLVTIVYIALFFDGLPWSLATLGILVHICYGSLLSTFPVISLLSPGFIGGTVFLVLEHYLAFQYFAMVWHPFQEVLSFFFICLWLVPFCFFISLSANDLVLPTMEKDYDGRRTRRSGFLAFVDLMAGKIGNISPSRSSKST